ATGRELVASAPDDDQRRATRDLVPAVPLVGLAEDVCSDDEAKLAVAMRGLEVLDQIERAARDEVRLLRELLLRPADARACAERRRRELAHRDAVLERDERLAERMAVRRDEPH